MIYLKKYDVSNTKVQYLISTDERLARLLNYIGTSELVLEKDGFKCLIKYIIGQQISDKAREVIWQRFYRNLCTVTPEVVLSVDDVELRKIGLSGRKVEYIKILAKNIVEGKIDFERFHALSNKEIIDQLTNLRGIGPWTAEMYLIFSLGREDILSQGDGTIKRTIQWMYDLKELPSSKLLSKYFINWYEYSTIVSSYLWTAIALDLTQKPFDEMIPKRS